MLWLGDVCPHSFRLPCRKVCEGYALVPFSFYFVLGYALTVVNLTLNLAGISVGPGLSGYVNFAKLFILDISYDHFSVEIEV